MSAHLSQSSAPSSLREARKEFTRARLCAAANDVFVRRGFANATMDEIARVAGTQRSTLYLYFGDKERLLAAIADDYIVKICEVVERLPGPVPSVEEIRIWLDDFARFVHDQRAPTELIRSIGQQAEPIDACTKFGLQFLAALGRRTHAFAKAQQPGQGIMAAWAHMMLWHMGDALVFRADQGDTQAARDRLFVAAALLHRFMREDL